MKFLNSIFFLTLFFNSYVQAMLGRITGYAKPRLDVAEFKNLSVYTNGFLQTHIKKLACQKNESGFIRFNIPAPRHMRNDIEKVRLNYWADTTSANIDPETIHNHPRYFESMIVNRGYTHALYQKRGHKNLEEYDNYRIFKDISNKKKMMFIERLLLGFAKEEQVKEGSIVTFPPALIHRVLQTKPLTLTLNVVFKGDSDETHYDVFLSKHGNIADVKTERAVLLDEDAYDLTIGAINLLDSFIKKN